MRWSLEYVSVLDGFILTFHLLFFQLRLVNMQVMNANTLPRLFALKLVDFVLMVESVGRMFIIFMYTMVVTGKFLDDIMSP